MAQGNRKVQYFVTFAVCLASVTTGVLLSWTTPALPKLNDNETSTHITREELSWVAALSSPGFMAGSLASRFISDRFGRKATILASAAPIVVATVGIVSSSSVWFLYLARFLWGTSVGMVATVSTIYLAEISDKEIRGTVSVSSRFMFNLGNFLVLAIGPVVSYDTLNYLLLILPVVYFSACLFIPETPYYTLKDGKVNDARKVLRKLRNYADEKELEDELDLMLKDVKKETLRTGSIKELFTGKQYRKALIVCIGLKITQMLSGTIVIQHYLGLIMKDSKIKLGLTTAFIIFGGVRFISGVVSSVLADRVGRRPLLIISYLGSGLSLGVTGAYFLCLELLNIEEEAIAPYGAIAFAGIIFSVILSTLGYNSLIYVIPAEMFPMNVKSVAMTLLNVFGGLSNFAIIKLYQQMINKSGLFGVFALFSIVSLIGGIFSFFTVPETKGKSLREILILLQGEAFDEQAENLNKPAKLEVNLNGREEETELQDIERKEV